MFNLALYLIENVSVAFSPNFVGIFRLRLNYIFVIFSRLLSFYSTCASFTDKLNLHKVLSEYN